MPQLGSGDNISVITDDDTSSVKKKSFGTARMLRRRGNKSVQSRLSTTNYSNDDAFPPFYQPQKELKIIIAELKSDDWQISNEALVKMRRITKHHSQLLVNSVVKSIVPDIVKLAESLRSTLSKNAVIVISELSSQLKRTLDPLFDLIFSKLIRKALDANSFISEQVKKSLVGLCSNCNQTKVMSSLTTSHTSRAIPVKLSVLNILQGITFLPRFYERQLQRIVTILNNFMNQGSLQIREKTKQLLNTIVTSQSGPMVLKYISSQHRGKLKKSFVQMPVSPSKIEVQEVSILEVKTSSQVVKETQELYPRRKKKTKITHFPQEFQSLDSYLENCQSSDWKIRLENMCLVAQMCRNYNDEVLQHRSSSKIVDILSKQINDPNTKVAVNALKIFIELTTRIPPLIQGSLSVIMNQIFICFSSMKTEVKKLAEQLFDTVADNVEKWMLTQHMCNGALYSIQKSKSTIIAKLTGLVPDIRKTKPNIFQKNVYSMINKVADQNKPEIMGPLKELLEVLYEQVGEDCMSYLKQKAKALLFQ